MGSFTRIDKYINEFTNGFKILEDAEIAKLSAKERAVYNEGLRNYRDIKNILDTAREEGIKKGMQESLENNIDINVKRGILKGYSNEIIADITGRSIEHIQKMREDLEKD